VTLDDVKALHPDLLYLDGFENCLMGIVERHGTVALCYDELKILETLEAYMDEENAQEYLAFNVKGAYVGEHTPFLFWRIYE
jgi:hypothetical protein